MDSLQEAGNWIKVAKWSGIGLLLHNDKELDKRLLSGWKLDKGFPWVRL